MNTKRLNRKQMKVYLLEQLKECKSALNRDYGVRKLGLFGSFVRTSQHPESDVDILVAFNRSIDLFRFMELEKRLGRILRKKVDLVAEKSLKPRIRKNVLREVEYI